MNQAWFQYKTLLPKATKDFLHNLAAYFSELHNLLQQVINLKSDESLLIRRGNGHGHDALGAVPAAAAASGSQQ